MTVFYFIYCDSLTKHASVTRDGASLNADYTHLPFTHTRIMVYNGQGEIGLVLAVKFFPKKASSGRKYNGGG